MVFIAEASAAWEVRGYGPLLVDSGDRL